jgi:hypothetical protein
MMMAKSAPEVVAAPAIQDENVEDVAEFEQEIEGEEVEGGDENLVLEVEGQTA